MVHVIMADHSGHQMVFIVRYPPVNNGGLPDLEQERPWFCTVRSRRLDLHRFRGHSAYFRLFRSYSIGPIFPRYWCRRARFYGTPMKSNSAVRAISRVLICADVFSPSSASRRRTRLVRYHNNSLGESCWGKTCFFMGKCLYVTRSFFRFYSWQVVLGVLPQTTVLVFVTNFYIPILELIAMPVVPVGSLSECIILLHCSRHLWD